MNFYLGIDVSKGYADFQLLNHRRTSVIPGFQLDDTHKGHQCLYDLLRTLNKEYGQPIIYAGVESTGGYENNWVDRLTQFRKTMVIHVARINPALIEANTRATGRRNKTDQISAWDIAEYMLTHPQKVPYDQEYYPNLKRQWRLIQSLIKQKNQLENQLNIDLYTSMPELLVFTRSGMPRWLLRLLSQYPTYKAVKDASIKELSQIPYISAEKAETVKNAINAGIGNSDRVMGQTITTLTTQILNLDAEIKKLKNFLEENYDEAREEVERLTTFPGIGTYSAVGLLMNILDIERFARKKKLISYWGVHPEYRMSGDGAYGFHMSKKGRSEPRKILYMVALTAIRINPIIKALYEKCLARKMSKKSAIGVCMHKIARIIYGMLKNKTEFDPEIDKANTKKFTPSQSGVKSNKTRRFQQYDHSAPISRRQAKKRMEQNSRTKHN